VAFKIPQGGHSVVAAVTMSSLLLVGAVGLTVVIESPLTQALAAAPAAAASATLVRAASDTPERARLAQCACTRWRRAATNGAGLQCDVDELVISQDWVVAKLNLHAEDLARPVAEVHAVEVMHLIDGHVDEDWHLASTRAGR